MAKLKLWVRNLIIVLVLAISIAGVGVGLYFLLKPEAPGPEEPPKRELTQAQKDYISAVEDAPQPDIDISTFDGLVLEDGTAVNVGDIAYVCGNYVVIENSSKPEFYFLQTSETNAASLANSQTNNVVLKKVNVADNYEFLVGYGEQDPQIFGDYAIVAQGKSNGEYTNQFIVSLKTGATVLQNSGDTQFSAEYVNEAEGENYAGSYQITIQDTVGNFMLVSSMEINSANIETEEIDATYVSTLYPLDNPSKKITFGETIGELVTYNITSEYLAIVTTKFTYVYKTELSSAGEWQEVLVLNNTFTAATGEDSVRVESQKFGNFSQAIYHNIQAMDNGLILVEKYTAEDKSTIIEGNYNVAYRVDVLDSKNIVAGINYSIYNTQTGEYLENIPDFFGKVVVTNSFAPGYYVFEQIYGGKGNNFSDGVKMCTIYDHNFTFVTEYRYQQFGNIIGYNGTNFITDATIINPWGEEESHHVGYDIVSNSSYDGIVVVKHDIYYYLYNTITGNVVGENYLYISQIMNGKVIAFKENVGYFTINLKDSGLPEEPIYNFDVESLNLTMASAGFYFTYNNGKYAYVGLDGKTYINVQSYSYKVIDNKIYLSLDIEGGATQLIVANMLSSIGSISETELAETYNFNQTPPATSNASAVTFLNATSLTSAANTVEVVDPNTRAKVSVTIDDKNIPTYQFSMGHNLAYYNGKVQEGVYMVPASQAYYDYYGFKIGAYVGGNMDYWSSILYASSASNSQYGISVQSWFMDYVFYWNFFSTADDEVINAVSELLYSQVTSWWNTTYKKEYPGVEFPLKAFIDDDRRFGVIGAVIMNTPYGFIVQLRYGSRGHTAGQNVGTDSNTKRWYHYFYYTDRVLVGLDKSIYALGGTDFNLGGNYSRSTIGNTIGKQSEFDALEEDVDPDYPSLTYHNDTNEYPIADIGWGEDSKSTNSDLVNAGICIGNYWAGLSRTKDGVFKPYNVTVYSTNGCIEDVSMGGTGTMQPTDFNYVAPDTSTINLRITPWLTTFRRYYGDLKVSQSTDDSATNRYGGLITISTYSRDYDSGWGSDNRRKIYVNFVDDVNKYVNANVSFNYSGVDGSVGTTVTGWNYRELSGSVNYESDYQYDNFWGNFCPKIDDIKVTYTQKRQKDLGNIFEASSLNVSGTSGIAYHKLFIADGVHSKIDYGFNNYGFKNVDTYLKNQNGTNETIPYLSQFTENCTFGYKFNGLAINYAEANQYSLTYQDEYGDDVERQWDGQFTDGNGNILKNAVLTRNGNSENLLDVIYNLTLPSDTRVVPSQTGHTVKIRYNYINPAVEGTLVVDNNYSIDNYWNTTDEQNAFMGGPDADNVDNADNATNFIYGQEMGSGFITLEDYDASSDNKPTAPRGYSFDCWELRANHYVQYPNSMGDENAGFTDTALSEGVLLDGETTHIFGNYVKLYGSEEGHTYTESASFDNASLTSSAWSNKIEYTVIDVYAKYTPKQYNFKIDLSNVGLDQEDFKLYVLNSTGAFAESTQLFWESGAVDYGTILTLPIMYVSDNNLFYKVAFYTEVSGGKKLILTDDDYDSDDVYFFDSDTGKVGEEEQQQPGYRVCVGAPTVGAPSIRTVVNDTSKNMNDNDTTDNTNDDINYAGANFYKWNCDSNISNRVLFNATLEPMAYSTTAQGMQDKHVFYSDDGEDGQDEVNEKQWVVNGVRVSGKVGYVNPAIQETSTTYFERNYEFRATNVPYGSNDALGTLTTIPSFVSGQPYTFIFDNFTRNHRLILTYEYTDDSGENTTYAIFYNYKETEIDTMCDDNPWELDAEAMEEVYHNPNNNGGTWTVTMSNAVQGGSYSYDEDDKIGKFTGNVSVKIYIDEAPFYVEVQTKDDGEEDGEEESAFSTIDAGELTLSDKINGTIDQDNHGHLFEYNNAERTGYNFGYGTTVLITPGSGANKKIHGLNLTVANQYISGLEISLNGETKFTWTADDTSNDDTSKSAIGDIYSDIVLNSGNYRKLVEYGTGTTPTYYSIEDDSEYVILLGEGYSTNVLAFLKLLYEEDTEDKLKGNENTAYVVYKVIELQAEKAYMVITCHKDSANSTSGLGVRTAIFYTLDDGNYDTTKSNQYTIKLTYTKFSSVLTWDATFGDTTSQTGSVGFADKVYLTDTLKDGSGDKVYLVDSSNNKYINVLGRKVYVDIVEVGEENRLKVNIENTSTTDYSYLFGDSGILKNNYESNTGYLFTQQGSGGNVNIQWIAGSQYDNGGAEDGSYFFGEKGKILYEANDALGNPKYSTDGTGNYVSIFDKKVYVNIVTVNNKQILQIDRTKTSAANLDYLFGASGVAKDKYDSTNDYLLEDSDDAGKPIDSSNINFAGIQPSNRFTYNINVNAGYYVKSVKIYYESHVYEIKLQSFKINNDQTLIIPVYSVYEDGSTTKYEVEGATEFSADIGTGYGTICEIVETLLHATFNKLPLSDSGTASDSRTAISLNLAYIRTGAHISVEFGAYTMLAVEADTTLSVRNISWNVDNNNADPTELKVYQANGTADDNTIATITFNTKKPSKILASAIIPDKNSNTYEDLVANTNGGGKIYFMLLDYNLDETDSANYMHIQSSFTENTLYRLEKVSVTDSADNANDNTATTDNTKKAYDNTATWAQVDANTQTTQQKITTTNGDKFIASVKITTATINTNITSDIDFGTDSNSNVVEETLFTNQVVESDNGIYVYYNDAYVLYDAENEAHAGLQRYNPIALTTDWFYEVGTNGQIASNNTSLEVNSSDNFTAAEGADYSSYGSTYALRGNTLIYTIATVYGYEFTGVTITLTVKTVNTDLTLSDGTSEVVEITTESTLTSDYFIYSWDDNELTITLTDAAITNINVDLHYNAKEFTVTYNTSADFGTSYVGLNSVEATSAHVTNQSRTFTYNVKADVDAGVVWNNTDKMFEDSSDGNVVYNRIGYDLVGWAFGEFYKKDDGKVIDTTKIDLTKLNKADISNFVTNEEVADEYDYILQKYTLATNAGYNWYKSLDSDFGAVFEQENNTIIMYAIWQAKDYTLVFDYNDITDGKGSTRSTQIKADWTFDMPLTAADVDTSSLIFDASNFTPLQDSISRVYRLGYTFNGWYYTEGTMDSDTANSTGTWAGQVLADGGTETSTFNSEIYTTEYTGKLGYNVEAEKQYKEEDKLFGYKLYTLMNSSGNWTETAGEDTSTIKLFAKWTANTYTFIYDLNGDQTGSAANKYQWLTLNGGSPSITTGEVVGSSPAYLGLTKGVDCVNVTFDTDFADTIQGYAYRNGYKFMGWSKLRNTTLDSTLLADADLYSTYPLLEEETTLNCALLLEMMGYEYSDSWWNDLLDSEKSDDYKASIRQKLLAPISAKVDKDFGEKTMSVIETLKSNGFSVEGFDVDEYNNVSLSYTGNVMLLHAVWQALPYTINIDLNNWNHEDYDWTDSDYFAGDNEYYNDGDKKGKNNVAITDIKLEIYFDQAFSTIKLWVDDAEVVKATESTIVNGVDVVGKYYTTIKRNNVTYTITGATAYDVLIQILTAYGYELGVEGDEVTYNFVLSADGKGTESGSYDAEYLIKADTQFNNNHFNLAICHNSTLEAEDNVDDAKTVLDEEDLSDDNPGDLHDTAVTNAAFGTRTFTLFALWTIKNVNISSSGTKELYSNALDRSTTYPTLFHEDKSNTVEFVSHDGNNANLFKTQETSGIYNSNNTYYLSPSTGHYIEELTIWFADNYLINGATTNKVHGYIHLTFAWNSVTHEVTITSAKIGSGTDITDHYKNLVISADGKSVTISADPINNSTYADSAYLFKSGITISVSKYQQVTTQNVKNINTYYESNKATYGVDAPTWLTDAHLQDVNYLTIDVKGVKSNMCFESKTKGQTYQVDYYRFIRPNDGMQTYIEEDSQVITFGDEIWDSQFLNSWSQYEVYKTETFKYGQYANTGYSYATNFAFGGWYYYQGHITNYEEYANYGEADHIYQTHSDGDNRYCTLCGDYCELAETYRIYDFLGKWGVITKTSGSDDEDFTLNAYKEYVWDDVDKKYYLKGSVDKEDYIDGIQVDDNIYEPYYKVDLNGNPILIGGAKDYITTLTIRNYKYGDGNTYKDNSGNEITLTQYADYKFDGKPVSGNLSLVGIYVPAGERKVHYYTWKDNQYTNTGYDEYQPEEDRNYVLGVKRVAEVSDDGDGLSKSYSYVRYWELGTNDKYYNVGFSAFSKFGNDNNPTELAALEFLLQFVNPDIYSDYETNYNDSKLTIKYSELLCVIRDLYKNKIVNKLLSDSEKLTEANNILFVDGDKTKGPKDTVKNIALNLQKALLKIDAYTAYIYLGESETLSQLGINDLAINPNVKFEVEGTGEYNALWLDNIQKLYTKLLGSDPGTKTPEEMSDAIIDQLSAKQLDALLSAVANDYFGFVLINPSPNIGHWPKGTYLTGWYMVPETMLELLMQPDYYDYAFTFNSDIWPEIDLADPKYPNPIIIQDSRPENINGIDILIYTVNLKGQSFEVTRFSTYDNVYNLHMLSRVETSVHIFAAYNVFKFEMTESGVNDTEYDENGNVTRPGDIQWGTDVQQTNGDFYQYTASDVHYVALTEDQMGLLSDELTQNKNLPTALQTVITYQNLTVEDSWSTAITKGTYIIAFVYNKQLNETTGTVENIGESINTVADKCYYVNEDTVTDLLTELFD